VAAATALSLPTALSEDEAERPPQIATEIIPLEEAWQFRLDPAANPAPAGLSDEGWQSVVVPHTWQSLGGSPEYVGVAWYRTKLFAPEAWRNLFVRIAFEAVYHTAHVFLNGTPIGQHIGKGYTAFTSDLSPHLKYDATNELQVRVDNSFSNSMLPRMKSFDWANDGGLIRPVQLLVTPPVFIEQLVVDAVPDLDRRTASVAISAWVRNSLASEQHANLSAVVRSNEAAAVEHPSVSAQTRLPAASTGKIEIGTINIASPRLWDFDHPHLYWTDTSVATKGLRHTLGAQFGIRKFEVRGTSFYLNGERVSLMGVERMAGSHPQIGMAEPTAWIDANHRDLKDLNCVYTRVHWPQDKRVLDFCDCHGILMQEEVPAWGSFTFESISADLLSQLETNGLEQLREMVERDRNHPCIVSWGLCNEVDGKNPNSRAFAHTLAQEARKIDPFRLLTYASNTLGEHPELDMAGDFDFISANEYFGSWYPGGPEEVRQYLARLRQAFPDKPIVISEYGWCECQPTIPSGDENRVQIVREHTRVLRESGEVAGAIYFDYNDYRTLVGDKGTGAFRQRVHGVVDLYARRKPSFDALRQESSPIKSIALEGSERDLTLHFESRADLPAYALRGYAVRWVFYGYDDLPMGGTLQHLDPLTPGQNFSLHASADMNAIRRVVADVVRPTGFSVGTAELTL
jgi:beta-galactosidase